MKSEAIIRTKCYLCDGPIEFPAELTNQTIPCPHCQKEVRLLVPVPKPPLGCKERPTSWLFREIKETQPFGRRAITLSMGAGTILAVVAVVAMWGEISKPGESLAFSFLVASLELTIATWLVIASVYLLVTKGSRLISTAWYFFLRRLAEISNSIRGRGTGDGD